MITDGHRSIMTKWAKDKIPINRAFSVGNDLKNVKKGQAIAIIAPSHLLHKVDYYKLLESKNIDTMSVNKGFLMPGSDLLDYYLPLSTHGLTAQWNHSCVYSAWLSRFKGLVMHGMHVKDSINPYILATAGEVQFIINKCPNTNFMIWRHWWGDYLRGAQMHKMCEFPYFNEWTPSKIPWAHCGAISGFAISLAMILGYTKIYVVGMGYMHVTNTFADEPNCIPITQTQRRGTWLQAAPIRFKNQAKLAHGKGITLQVGPKALVEPELLKYFKTFDSVDNLV